MKTTWLESHNIISWMYLIIIILLLAVLFKEGVISITSLVNKKELINSVSELVTIAAILIGGILSYLKYFKRRLFKPKLNIVPSVGLIELENDNLHWINLELENKGSAGIWNYKIKVIATLHGNDTKDIEINNFFRPEKYQENLIDVGESAYEHATLNIPKDIYAITFNISITDKSGANWYRSITSANKTKN